MSEAKIRLGQVTTLETQLNTIYGQANSAYTAANGSQNSSNTVYADANTANTTAKNAYAQANLAYTAANSAQTYANTLSTSVNSTVATINTNYQAAYAAANTGATNALNAYAQANSAYTTANNALPKAGGTMTGNLIMSAATVNTSIANISTVITGNALSIGTGIGSNSNVTISANGTEYWRMINTGNIGVGTSTPAYKMEVSGTLGVTGAATLSSTLDVTGIASFAAGSAALPSITRTGDLNTGFWFPAADTIAASTGGTERMRIAPTYGNVLIGATSQGAASLGYMLGIQSGGSQTYLSIAKSGQTLDTGGMVIGIDGTGGAIYVRPNQPLDFYTNDTQRARIDASGNLGIGTASPAELLTVVGNIRLNGNRTVIFQPTSGVAVGAIAFKNSAGTLKAAVASYYNVAEEGALEFVGPTGSTNMMLNSSGVLGIGVTPSAWGNGAYKAIQIGGSASIMGRSAGSDSYFMSNTYYDQTDYRYTQSLAASYYSQNAGAHNWFNAASGTAGNVATFTQRMTLDASGNLLVGTTSTSGSISNTVPVVAGLFKTVSGSSVSANANELTIATIPTTINGLYIVSMGINANDPANYSSVSIVTVDGPSTLRITSLQTCSYSTLSVSGMTVRARQNSGASQTIYYTLTRLS